MLEWRGVNDFRDPTNTIAAHKKYLVDTAVHTHGEYDNAGCC